MPTLLIVEDETVLARTLTRAFTSRGWTVHHAAGAADARRATSTLPADVVLLDLRLPDGSGLDVLADIGASAPDVPVVMMTGHGSVAEAVEAMKRGARDFVQKPFELDEIRLKVERALGATRVRREIAYYRERERMAGTILGESTAVQTLRRMVERLAHVTAGPGGPAPTVLLLGETGTGKGHVARALHAAGGRRDGPFVEVNCTALPENLVEAELFGHEKGAFTDARTARAGLFETADGGTIFLDEIGHISQLLQSKFLKTIEEKTIRRLGATSVRPVDVQVVAATSRDLEAAVRLGEFREDLHQRLAVAVIRIPPLRERGRDVLLLAGHFLDEASRRYASGPRSFSPAAEAALLAHAWPGNVRELANVMERAVLFSDREELEPDDLGLAGAPGAAGQVAAGPSGEVRVEFPDSGLSLEAVERALLVAALDKSGGNQSAAARLLGVSRDTLRYRMDKFGLEQ
jgi:two-component system, NtrC family, response regulator AtoC